MSTEDAVVGIVGLAIAAKILQDNDRPRNRDISRGDHHPDRRHTRSHSLIFAATQRPSCSIYKRFYLTSMIVKSFWLTWPR